MRTINGLSVYTYGTEDKQPVVFIHGFPFDNTMWKNQTEKLQETHYVITIDIRGFGKSETGDGQYTMEMFADDLNDVIIALSLNKPVICGLSMGGYIALRYAEKYDNYSALILADTKSQSDPDPAKLNRAAGIKTINEDGPSLYVSNFIPNTLAKKNKTNEDILTPLMIEAKKVPAVSLKGALLAMAGRTDTTEYLKTVNKPVMFICGEEDAFTPPDLMKELSEITKGSRFEVVKDAGHLPPIENPANFNLLLVDFLSGLE